jgi:hypothetical protein
MTVIPAQAGIQLAQDARNKKLDPGFRRGDASFGGGDIFFIVIARLDRAIQ